MFSSPRAAIFSAYGALCWVLFLVTALSALVLTLPLPTVTQRRHVTRTAARLFLGIAGFRLKVVGLDLLPQAPCVLVANHASYLDGLVMHAVLPVRFAFIIKKEMVTVPLAGFLLRRLGSEFVERHDRHRAASDARRVLRRAAGGEALACFPEGTFARRPGVHRFHAGAFVAASRAGLEVVPAVIRGTREILPDGRFLPWPGRIVVELLCVLPAATEGETDAAARLRRESRQVIIAHLGEPDLDPRQAPPAGQPARP